jgi:hypothetical protein
LDVDGDEVHSPIVAQKRGMLLYKSDSEKVTKKKEKKKEAMSCVTLIPFKGNEKNKVTYFPSPSA